MLTSHLPKLTFTTDKAIVLASKPESKLAHTGGREEGVSAVKTDSHILLQCFPSMGGVC